MPKYRKKPVVIEAEQFNAPTIIRWDDPACTVVGWMDPPPPLGVQWIARGKGELEFYIETLEGKMTVSDGDWIITGVKGEKYPCKPDIFEKTYEPVETSNNPPPDASESS